MEKVTERVALQLGDLVFFTVLAHANGTLRLVGKVAPSETDPREWRYYISQLLPPHLTLNLLLDLSLVGQVIEVSNYELSSGGSDGAIPNEVVGDREDDDNVDCHGEVANDEDGLHNDSQELSVSSLLVTVILLGIEYLVAVYQPANEHGIHEGQSDDVKHYATPDAALHK